MSVAECFSKALATMRDEGIDVSDETVMYARKAFGLVERRPTPQQMTDTERLDFFGEHCDKYEYVKPMPTGIGHHVIICDGQRTIAASFRDAVDTAAVKWKAANE